MNACMSEFRIVNPTLRTFSAAEARIAHSSIRFNNLSAAELGYPEHIRLLISSDGCTLAIQACDPKDKCAVPFMAGRTADDLKGQKKWTTVSNRMLTRFIAVERRKISNFGRGDNHAPRMLTGVTRDAFQLARHVDQRFDLFVRFIDFRQLRFSLKGFCQRHARIGRHQLGDTIDKSVRVTQHATDIADDRFRRHGTEGDDLRYRVAAVHIRHVLDNLVAFLHAEVDVKVGH